MDIINDMLKTVTGITSGLWPEPSFATSGLVGERLRPCPGTPNCVCSEHSDSPEWVEPLAFREMSPDEAWKFLKEVIGTMDGEVKNEQEGYLWSTFTVPVFGFVDDVEFRMDASEAVIQVRSASRLGFSDLGVNRGRVEEFRRRFAGRIGG